MAPPRTNSPAPPGSHRPYSSSRHSVTIVNGSYSSTTSRSPRVRPAVASASSTAWAPPPNHGGGGVASALGVSRARGRAAADRRVGEHADDRVCHASADREHGADDHRDRGGALDLQVLEQAQVAQPGAAGEVDAEPVRADALARAH